MRQKTLISALRIFGKICTAKSGNLRKISKQKAQSYLDAKVDFILTTCPACQLGLNQGLTEILAENSKEKNSGSNESFLVFGKILQSCLDKASAATYKSYCYKR